MAIPEDQLETWSHQGSITQSSATYATVKNALESSETPYAGKDYSVFLQGSYGNDTNIYAESDVDIVALCRAGFHHDLNALPAEQQAAFNASRTNAAYTHTDFKRDVVSVLQAKYGGDVKPEEKAIAISANGTRRKADVIAAIEFRRYFRFNGWNDQRYEPGICFYTKAGQQIANYPKQHSENCTKKHQQTQTRFKPLVRIFKNLRGWMVENNLLAEGAAPSYYIEGLLYNVPDDKFVAGRGASFLSCINWLHAADRSKFLCANKQYYLLHDTSPVTWRAEKCKQFIDAAIEAWNHW